MTALIRKRAQREDVWKYREFTLTSGTRAFQGGSACVAVGTGKVIPASPGPGRLFIGVFAEDCDATAGDKLVNIDLVSEIPMRRWVNDTAVPVTALDIGKLAYFIDDQTVSLSGAVLAGRIWDVHPTKGVAIEKLDSAGGVDAPALPTFAAGASAPAMVQSGAVYDVPTTAGASTITLPAAAPNGTVVTFTADGTKNGHTVTYVDGTGAVALTTALTASKRHVATATKCAGKWFVNAYVAP